jgi:hypothetical protein
MAYWGTTRSPRPASPATAPGSKTLVEVIDEPPGGRCPGGGTAVLSGVDDDGDGVLDAEERDDTIYVCETPGELDSVHFGDLGIASPSDLQLLVGIEHVTGSLVIDAPEVTALDLSTLRQLGGGLDLGRSGLPALDAPLLERAAFLRIYDVGAEGGVAQVSLPALRVIDGSVFVHEDELADIDLSALERIGSAGLQGELHIGSPILESLDLASLWLVTDDWYASLPALSTLAAPQLRIIDDLQIQESAVVLLAFPALEEVNTLAIYENPLLEDIAFPVLTEAVGLTIVDNPGLPTCQADALVTQSGASSIQISGNDDGGSCE